MTITRKSNNSALNAIFVNVSKEMAQIIQTVGTTTYVCIAPPGSLSSAAVWKIYREVVSGGGTIRTVTWADGNAQFDNVADNRATLTYS